MPAAGVSRVLMVEVWRGGHLESEHQVHAAICDSDGVPVRAWGDWERVVYPRSAVKPMQAFPLVATGAAESFGLTDAEIAVVCASHSGEVQHLDTVRSVLAKAGLDESLLRCGPRRPLSEDAADELACRGERPQPIHNNCSGKHAGMLALSRFLGTPLNSYLDPDHAVQRDIFLALARLSGMPVEQIGTGVDGCCAPAATLPLAAMAAGFARLAAAHTGTPAGDAAARRIVGAMMAHPEMVAGEGHFDTVLMRELPDVVFCKSGAEGFLCAGIPRRGMGLALKVADGAGRAAAPAAMHLLNTLGVLPDPLPEALAVQAAPIVTDTCGFAVGCLRVVER